MTAIYKRETRAFFNTMTGYVFVSVVMLFISLNFRQVNLVTGYPYFAAALASSVLAFVVAAPILTMRSFADERRAKTDQLLLTYPVGAAEIVLGKYFAMLTVFAIPLAISCLCPVVLGTGFAHSYRIDYSAIFICLCLGALFVAIGMFISSLTESLIIAAVGTAGALLAVCLWTQLISLIPGQSWLAPLKTFLGLFAFLNTVSNFTAQYVFDIKGAALMLCTAALFVFLTVRSLRRRRSR